MTTTISPQAETVLAHRYFLKNENHEAIETPEVLFHRVANAIAEVEDQYLTLPVEKQLLASEFYDMMSDLDFLPNSPTLMNAGTEQGTLSACFVLPLEDSMEGIMKAASDAAMVQKFGGGTGFALSKLRPKGASIKTTHGKACGPVAVLKVLSSVSSMVTQGGKRDGANMAVMSVYHPDILEFIDCKSTEGDIHNFNISVGVDSQFMKMVEYDLDYGLFDPSTDQMVDSIPARHVFRKICEGAWKNGEPGMVFIDKINADNHVQKEFGPMTATNPCGEQPLLPNESCNLGSINLANFVDGGDIDWHRLRKITKLVTNFLDNVIDANYYATPEIEQMTKATRKIGVGVMGFADLLVKLRVSYDSELAREIGNTIMESIKLIAEAKSLELGAIRGTFPAWEDSQYNIRENYRNSCRLTVAPTGTISMIANCASGIEPLFALAWRKENILEGQTLYYVNEQFEKDAKDFGFYSEELMAYLAGGGLLKDRNEVPQWVKNVYITAPEISPDAHVLMQATFQRHVDSGISKTINFASSATIEDVADSYMAAWENSCKGITVYRNGSREKEVLVTGHAQNKQLPLFETGPCGCEKPNIIKESGCETCKTCGWSACVVA